MSTTDAEKEQARLTRCTKVAQEILSTERSYVESLEACINVWQNPLQTLALSDPVLTEEQLTVIFSNLQPIYTFHRQFLKDMEHTISDWDAASSTTTPSSADDSTSSSSSSSSAPTPPPAGTVGKGRMEVPRGHIGALFKSFAPFLKMYTQYVNNHENSSQILNELIQKKRKKFIQFCNTALTDARCKGNSLQSLLIMPVQRVPRYKLLLQELIKHTSPLHPDYPALKDAHASIDRVAVHINEALRRQQNQADLMALQAQFSHSIALVKPGRVLVYQGPSVKRGRRGDVLYHFMLFNDTLCYATASRTGRLSMHRELTIDKVFSVIDMDEDLSTPTWFSSPTTPGGLAFSLGAQLLDKEATVIAASQMNLIKPGTEGTATSSNSSLTGAGKSGTSSSSSSSSSTDDAATPLLTDKGKDKDKDKDNNSAASDKEMWSLKILAREKSFVAFWKTQAEKDMWLLHLRACIADSALRLTSREAALVSNNSSSAAQVVQNKSVYGATQPVNEQVTPDTVCVGCQLPVSSMDRYWCNMCGCIGHSNCCQTKLYLQWCLGTKRVCDSCVDAVRALANERISKARKEDAGAGAGGTGGAGASEGGAGSTGGGKDDDELVSRALADWYESKQKDALVLGRNRGPSQQPPPTAPAPPAEPTTSTSTPSLSLPKRVGAAPQVPLSASAAPVTATAASAAAGSTLAVPACPASSSSSSSSSSVLQSVLSPPPSLSVPITVTAADIPSLQSQSVTADLLSIYNIIDSDDEEEDDEADDDADDSDEESQGVQAGGSDELKSFSLASKSAKPSVSTSASLSSTSSSSSSSSSSGVSGPSVFRYQDAKDQEMVRARKLARRRLHQLMLINPVIGVARLLFECDAPVIGSLTIKKAASLSSCSSPAGAAKNADGKSPSLASQLSVSYDPSASSKTPSSASSSTSSSASCKAGDLFLVIGRGSHGPLTVSAVPLTKDLTRTLVQVGKKSLLTSLSNPTPSASASAATASDNSQPSSLTSVTDVLRLPSAYIIDIAPSHTLEIALSHFQLPSSTAKRIRIASRPSRDEVLYFEAFTDYNGLTCKARTDAAALASSTSTSASSSASPPQESRSGSLRRDPNRGLLDEDEDEDDASTGELVVKQGDLIVALPAVHQPYLPEFLSATAKKRCWLRAYNASTRQTGFVPSTLLIPILPILASNAYPTVQFAVDAKGQTPFGAANTATDGMPPPPGSSATTNVSPEAGVATSSSSSSSTSGSGSSGSHLLQVPGQSPPPPLSSSQSASTACVAETPKSTSSGFFKFAFSAISSVATSAINLAVAYTPTAASRHLLQQQQRPKTLQVSALAGLQAVCLDQPSLGVIQAVRVLEGANAAFPYNASMAPSPMGRGGPGVGGSVPKVPPRRSLGGLAAPGGASSASGCGSSGDGTNSAPPSPLLGPRR